MTRARYGEGALIACDNLVRIFKVADLEVVALQGLDLLVERGEMMAIVGASGSGKSTLLNILGGLDAPSAGRAVVAGHDLAQMGRRERTAYRRRVVGMVWQQTARNLLPYLERARERRAADDPRRRVGPARPGPRAARARRARGSPGASPRGSVGRRAAARRDRGRAGQRPGGAPRRRADRRARQRDLGRDLRAHAPDQRGGRDDGRGRHPRSARVGPGHPDGPHPRRPDEHRDPAPDRAGRRRRPSGHRRGVRACSTGSAGCSCRAPTSRPSRSSERVRLRLEDDHVGVWPDTAAPTPRTDR